MTALFQLYKPLDAATEAALRASIQRFGVLSPIALDQHGRILDGHQRKRISDELGVECPSRSFEVQDDDEAREVARTLNEDRRQLSAEDRRPVVAALREEGHSVRAIAGAVGVSKAQVERDLKKAGVPPGTPDENPKKISGVDGKQYPAESKKSKAAKRAIERGEPIPEPVKPAKKKGADDNGAAARIAELEAQLEAATEAAAEARNLHDRLSALEITEPDEQQKEILRLRKEIAKLEAEVERLTRSRNDCQNKNNQLIRQVKLLQRKAGK